MAHACAKTAYSPWPVVLASQIGLGGGGFGGGSSGGGGQNRRGQGTETAGSAFQMLLGGRGGEKADDGAEGSGNRGETKRGLRMEEHPVGTTAPIPPLPVRNGVWTRRVTEDACAIVAEYQPG